jgi:hypothetical protein
MYDCPPDDFSMDVKAVSNVQEHFIARLKSIRGDETETRLSTLGRRFFMFQDIFFVLLTTWIKASQNAPARIMHPPTSSLGVGKVPINMYANGRTSNGCAVVFHCSIVSIGFPLGSDQAISLKIQN